MKSTGESKSCLEKCFGALPRRSASEVTADLWKERSNQITTQLPVRSIGLSYWTTMPFPNSEIADAIKAQRVLANKSLALPTCNLYVRCGCGTPFAPRHPSFIRNLLRCTISRQDVG
jgi:hypothetical protein